MHKNYSIKILCNLWPGSKLYFEGGTFAEQNLLFSVRRLKTSTERWIFMQLRQTFTLTMQKLKIFTKLFIFTRLHQSLMQYRFVIYILWLMSLQFIKALSFIKTQARFIFLWASALCKRIERATAKASRYKQKSFVRKKSNKQKHFFL